MTKNHETIGSRKFFLAIAFPYYSDCNDGLARTHCSRNKNNYSRIHKINKINRVKPYHKTIANDNL